MSDAKQQSQGIISLKIACLTSKYPSISHTFILREVAMLRSLGIDVHTFSIRPSYSGEVAGQMARVEAAKTRWLVPQSPWHYLASWLWLLGRPRRLTSTLRLAIITKNTGLRQRLLWFCYFLEAALLARWLVRERFDHLHCHFGNSGASTGMLAAQLAGVPFSLTCHGSELLQPQLHRLSDKVAHASFVACVSKYGRAQLMMASLPEMWPKMHIIRCGPPESHAAIDPLQPRTGNHILCVARLSQEKGHLVLLEALAILVLRGWHGICTLIGDGPMRPVIERRIQKLGLSQTVCLAGAMEADEVMHRYAAADVVVLSSFAEGVPVVLMEAMACRRPVVATRVGGVPELVIDGVTGLLAAPGDPVELADQIWCVLADPNLAHRLAQNGAEHVAREFDAVAAARMLHKLLRGQCPPRRLEPSGDGSKQ